MTCKHERIKSVNCVIFCADCGAKLPIDYLVGKDRIKAQNEQETPGTDAPAQDAKPAKKTARKKVAK